MGSLKEFGYCIHLYTGKDLGDMCESYCNERERMIDYKFWNFVFRLPKGYKIYDNWFELKYFIKSKLTLLQESEKK